MIQNCYYHLFALMFHSMDGPTIWYGRWEECCYISQDSKRDEGNARQRKRCCNSQDSTGDEERQDRGKGVAVVRTQREMRKGKTEEKVLQ